MKKFNRHFFVTVVILIALSATLTGCGKKKNPPITEVIVDETSIPTQEIVTQTVEPIESSTPTVEPISTVDGNNTVSTSEPSYTVSVFDSYWDHENNAFDLKEYLESTNPYKLFEYSNSGIIDDYCVMYGTENGPIWGVEITAYTILIYDVCAVDQRISVASYDLFSTNILNATSTTLNKDGFTMTDRNVSSIEVAVTLAMQAIKKSDAGIWIKEQLKKDNIYFTEKEFMY